MAVAPRSLNPSSQRRGNQRRPPSRFSLLIQLLDELLKFTSPADVVMSAFFKAHPKLGSRDRHFLAEAAWTVLRNRSWYAHLASSGSGPQHRRYALLAVMECFGRPMADSESQVDERTWLDHVGVLEHTTVDPFLRESSPDWVAQAWSNAVGRDEAIACAKAMRSSAPLDLRVNKLLASPKEVIASLAQDGIEATPIDVLDGALRVQGKPALQRSKAFQSGLIEVQDLGSQLLAALVCAKRGEFIVDFCAGAGGKTLALGAAMNNTGRLYALDTSAARLSRFKPRLVRSGLSNVWPCAISGFKDDRVKRLAGKADAVLVDAPCSGLGTLRRNPDLKWRMSIEKIHELQQQQFQILLAASGLVKPGGRLVYGTCSLLAKENQEVIEGFLRARPEFVRVSVQSVLTTQRIALPGSWQALTPEGDLLLWPHRSQTDGFYAACLVRAGQASEGVG
ncbi:MAG: RsmB/NOP family class I SAM-dependent RNA methyltransferase [Burkholderiaceae bacterium]|nr:RsmB/NOP family class I SAM-dependent RNA methyltransferase [Burkholderiaceae bacterium]